jgi:hypothetical protein
LAAAPAASAFFRTVAGTMLHEAETPESVIEFIEQRLGISRWRVV